ncbi:MAG: hypothetical protein VX835_01170 [Pseudomonadota bacterium]|nr:hypothetical protein [Pseudomonadota bacterium]
MFIATYQIINEQFTSLYRDRSTYAKIFLAPLATMIFLFAFSELIMAFDKTVTSYDVHNINTLVLNLVFLVFTPLIFFYAIKGIIQTIRFIVKNESPYSYFGFHLFKQAYLFLSYVLLFLFFSSTIATSFSIYIYIPILIYILYAFTWYPYNLISVAADVHVDFFKIGYQIGKWAFMNFLILLFFSLTFYCVYRIDAFFSPLPLPILLFITYFLTLNKLGCFARSFLSFKNIH